MTDEAAPQFDLPEDWETARRIAFAITRTERSLGIVPLKPIPLGARLDALLEAAMTEPKAIEPEVYELCYRLRCGGSGGSERPGGAVVVLPGAATSGTPA